MRLAHNGPELIEVFISLATLNNEEVDETHTNVENDDTAVDNFYNNFYYKKENVSVFQLQQQLQMIKQARKSMIVSQLPLQSQQDPYNVKSSHQPHAQTRTQARVGSQAKTTARTKVEARAIATI